jgi:hypothetical protein
MKICDTSEKHKNVDTQLFRIKIYSPADSAGTKRNCMWREGRNVALVSAKLITSIFAFSTNFRNSEWRFSSAGEPVNTMIFTHNTRNTVRCFCTNG